MSRRLWFAMKFIGRERELAQLSAAYASAGSAFIPVYGRRRIGKTELLLHFVGGRQHLFYVGQRAPAALQLSQFMAKLSEAVREPLLGELAVREWRQAFERMTERLPTDGKLVIVLDEFQWMAQVSPELPSLLQEFWDLHWSRTDNVMLLLCGSFIGFMERDVLGKDSPLFGRKTGQILLQPFDHREAAGFHPQLGLADQARTYFICGGVPHYLRLFDGQRSVAQNVQALLLDPGGALHSEADFLLREELREVERFFAVLMAIAQGDGTPADIEKRSGVRARSLAYYTGKMEALGYTRRRHPLSDGPANPRKVRHALEDPLLRFWFRFLYGQATELARYSPRENFQALVEPYLPAYFGSCFERLCRVALHDLLRFEGVRAKVGEYWEPSLQIDVLALRTDGEVEIGECKWGNVSSWPALVRELRSKQARYCQDRTTRLRAFVRSTPPQSAKIPDALRVHSLADLYGGETGREPGPM